MLLSTQDTRFGEDEHLTTGRWGASLRVGAHQAVSPRVSLWLRAGLGYQKDQNEVELDSEPAALVDSRAEHLIVDTSALLLFHVVPHLFVAAGPGLVYDDVDTTPEGGESHASATTSYALRLEIGGYW